MSAARDRRGSTDSDEYVFCLTLRFWQFEEVETMLHRHLNHEEYTLAAHRRCDRSRQARGLGSIALCRPRGPRPSWRRFFASQMRSCQRSVRAALLISGGSMPSNTSELPEWEQVLSAAAHLHTAPSGCRSGWWDRRGDLCRHRISTRCRPRSYRSSSSVRGGSGPAESLQAGRLRVFVNLCRSSAVSTVLRLGIRQLIRDQPFETKQIERCRSEA